jgi:hypothetical protein
VVFLDGDAPVAEGEFGAGGGDFDGGGECVCAGVEEAEFGGEDVHFELF